MNAKCKICGERILKYCHSALWLHLGAGIKVYDHVAELLRVREGPYNANKAKRV